jgi:phosphate starvation-inducible PhoH-like protein
MAQKMRSRKDRQIKELTEVLETNGKAITEGPRKKNFTNHDLRHIRPLNAAQESMFESYFQGNNIIAHGSAGTGKSYCALFLALNDLLNKKAGASKIMIVRSAVQGRDIGALPGTIFEKLQPYETPYQDIVASLMGKFDAYDNMKSLGLIEFIPTSFVRGLTWDNTIVIIDEIQNMNFHELNSIVTRIGENSRVIACGDIIQNDLFNKKNEVTGMPKFLEVARRSGVFDDILFTRNDIVRSDFVKKWICALEDTDKVVSVRAA